MVSYKDKLYKFKYEMFEQICKKFNTKLMVFNKVESEIDRTKELSKDLLFIVIIFVIRNNGLCVGKNKKKRKQQEIKKKKEEIKFKKKK
jgi:putative resolvase